MHAFADLVAQFESRIANQHFLRETPDTLYGPLRYFISLGGKRVRPVLCLMAAELLGEISEDTWHAATAIELFHNFTLVHDDIMDEAPLRRGQETLHTRFGLTSGILGGDALCILAYEQLTSIKSPLQPLLRTFNQTALEVCEGQQLDMDYEKRQDVSVDDYVEMIRLKTSVLLGCSLKMGALTAGGSMQVADKLYQFGQALGLAFQLQDDYLDAFGETALTGKQPGGDIQSGKKTYLHLKALEANELKYETALQWPAGPEKISAILELYDSTGAKAACRQAVAYYSERAKMFLDEVPVITSRKEKLRELSDYLLHREG